MDRLIIETIEKSYFIIYQPGLSSAGSPPQSPPPTMSERAPSPAPGEQDPPGALPGQQKGVANTLQLTTFVYTNTTAA